jgi:exonuclease SbcC
MRPISLAAEGFSAFRERVDVDFEDVSFFALVGPTGAGKSSVIDAMCFALYGFVPRYDDQRKVADAVTLGMSQSRVQLVFEVAGRRYTLTRVVRRTKSGASTKECRLERHLGDGATDVIAGDSRAVTKEIESLLGLSSDDFVRCVVLPQGQFAQFLHEVPSKRQELLVRLLDLGLYSRMATLARQRAADADARGDVLAAQLSELDGATPQAEQDAHAKVTALATLRERLDGTRPDVERLHGAVRDARRQHGEQDATVARLSATAPPPNLADLAASIGTARNRLDHATTAHDDVERVAEAAEAAVAAAPDLPTMRRILETYDDLDDLTARLQQVENDLAGARAATQAQRVALADATTALEAAEADLRALGHRHAAYLLTQTLTAGAPCPVCSQPVSAVVDVAEPAALADSTATRDTALVARGAADRRVHSAEKKEAEVAALARELHRRHDELRDSITDERDRATLVDEVTRVEALHLDATGKRKAVKNAQAVLAAARKQLAEFDSALDDARAAYTRQRDAMAALQPPPPTDDVVADWSTLSSWVDAQRSVAEAELHQRQEQLDAATGNLARLLDVLAEECSLLDVRPAGTVTYDTLCRATDIAHAKAESTYDRVRADRKKARALKKQLDTLTISAAIAKEVGRLLSAKQFESWVLTEALEDLVTVASETLLRLSDGAYSLSLTDGNDFVVIDHREADAERSIKTLSGGETFQAALSLALALADNLGSYAAAGASRLESIFLDEGFGTLDENCLDTVATTLETLASGERMVGIVTHVRELAERVPVRYEVRRNGRTATVEKVSV